MRLFAPRLLGPFTALVRPDLTPIVSSLYAVAWLLFPINVLGVDYWESIAPVLMRVNRVFVHHPSRAVIG